MAEDSKSVLHSLRDKAKDKDAMISKFLKSKDEILAMWESETDEMIRQIHQTRDEQVGTGS